MFKLATLFVDIQADQTGIIGMLGGVHGLFDKTIHAASHLNETISKTKAVFGDASGAIFKNADKMAERFGSPKQAIIDATDAFGMLAKASGKSGKEAADFGVKFAKMAADASSFYDVPIDVALQKLQAGLVGQSRPLREFGVFLSAATVAQEAFRLGLSKSANVTDVSENAKIMARASLITNSSAMKDATGDLERTLSQTENQTRKFWGSLENLGTNIGQELIPVFDQLLAAVSTTLAGISAGWENNKGTFRGWIETIRGGLETVAILWNNWGIATEITSVTIGAGLTDVQAVFTAVGANIVNIAKYIGDNWYTLIVDALNATSAAFTNFGSNMGNLGQAIFGMLKDPAGGFNFEWKPLLDGFSATAAALPELVKPAFVNIDDQIAALTTKMGDNVIKMGGGAAPAAKGLKHVMAMEDEAAGKQRHATSVGVAEFASKLRMAQGGKDTPEKQLTELQEIRKQEIENGKALAKLAEGGFGMVLG